MLSATIEAAPWTRRLAPSHALWLGPTGLWDFGTMPGWRPWAVPAAAPAAARHHSGFDSWCQATPGRGCQLVLSGWLLHELLLDAALPLADDTARLHYARGLLQHYHGDAAAQWPLAAWQAGGQRGVSALHATTLPALQASARQAGVALRMVRPWWSLALALAQQQLPTLASADSARLLVVDGLLVTQIDLARGRLRQLQQRRLAAASPAALQALQDTLAPTACCVAIGHGLLAPWPAQGRHWHGGDGGDQRSDTRNDTHNDSRCIQALGSLQGEAPAALWAGPAAEAAAPALVA